MLLSVVILNYNVKHFLEVCIRSVQKSLEYIEGEIIVVDNASTDGSREMMELLFPDVAYIYQKENTGFPKGNNIGVAKARGKYVCILNPDIIVAEDTFSILLKAYEGFDNPGILGCRLIDGSGAFLMESKRGTPTPWVALTKVLSLYRVFPKNRLFNRYYAQHLNENEKGTVDVLPGACMFMRKDLYEQTGGFDEGCFMYSDDIDLSYTILKKGLHNYYIPNTSVIHFKGESTLKDGLYMKRFKEAMQFFYKKHFRKSLIFDVLMNLGAAAFAFKKKSEAVQRNDTPEHYILVSADSAVYTVLKQKLNKPLDWVGHLADISVIDDADKRIEILVDNELISFKEYIAYISSNQESNKTFKIKAQNSGFFIGSNHRNDKGRILLL